MALFELTAPAQVTITAPSNPQATGVTVFLAFLVAETQLYKRLRLSVRPLVSPLVRHGHQVEKWGNERFRYCLCMFECWGWVGMWMGAGCPCPPVPTIALLYP